LGVPAVCDPDRESSDEVVAAKRLTGRNLAAAWSLAFVALAGFVAIGLTDLVCPSSRYQSIVGPAAPSMREPAPPS
jgi:hypothetical protein